MTSDRESIRERLQAEAAEGFTTLWPRVIAQRAAFLQALDGVSDEQAAWRPPAPNDADGEAAWSIIEVARHVVSYTRNVGDVIEATGQGRTETKLPPGHLAEEAGATLAEVRRSLTEATVHLAGIPGRLPAEPDTDTTVEHAAFGALNCVAWFAFIRLHDATHTAQVETLKQSEGFPA